MEETPQIIFKDAISTLSQQYFLALGIKKTTTIMEVVIKTL